MSASPSRPLSAPLVARVLAPLAAVALAAVALTACAPEPASPVGTPSPLDTEPSDGAVDPSDSPSVDPADDADAEGDERAQNLADAVASGNTAAIEGYLTDPTRVVIAASEADIQYDPVDAVLAIDYVQPGVGVWDFDLDPEVLSGYAASASYGQFFPAEAVVGVSDSGTLISFLPNGDKIGTIFMSIHESLVLE
ncbi:hypothetical protein [Protaetiibacter sp. SSC-01]|uniref:hypothetical protein n=1 Tax=Protaetiibacter sp. SSC-01 TaxID=2759943 RepID=UPI00223B4382|nr:hypothetical protein [Protaetiibacter sp. SSC-01]